MSLPPEQLLKARVLTALYSVRSEQLFCEHLGYNLLWLWFLDRELAEGSFDHSIFAKNYERLLSVEVVRLFFAKVYELSRQEGWTSNEHFESWASLFSTAKPRAKKPSSTLADTSDGNPCQNGNGNQPLTWSEGHSQIGQKTSARLPSRALGLAMLRRSERS